MFFIWSKFSDFVNEVMDYGGMFVEFVFVSGGLLGDILFCYLVIFVKFDCNFIVYY